MKKIYRKARKVRFGLRIKISAVMIAAVVITSAIISFAVSNQNMRNIQDEMERLGTTILKGAQPDIEKYFFYKQRIEDSDSVQERRQFLKNKSESASNAGDYFKSIIQKDRILDIAFLIENEYNQYTKWDNKKNSLFNYFNRVSGKITYRYRHDNQLKPSIYKYMINNISTTPQLVFREGRKEGENKFVIVGMPIFKDKTKKNIYNSYLQFKKGIFPDNDNVLKGNKPLTPDQIAQKKNYFTNIFIKRLVYINRTDYNFDIYFSNEKQKDLLFSVVPYYTNFNTKEKVQQDNIKKDFYKALNISEKEEKVNLKEIKSVYVVVLKKYRLQLIDDIKIRDLWKLYYFVLDKQKMHLSSPEKLDQLALLSYRSDLDGILGLYLFRNQFFAEIEKDRSEIFNLALSISLRCIIIALFLPTFIINKVNTLAKGAEKIGKGNLDDKIEISGSDELGRLADIFNVMTGNLRKAQVTMLEKQRMEEELKTAEQIQKALLPENFPDIPNFEFASYYSAQTESGGDYYDLLLLDENNLGIVIADVSGHGVGSGLVMAMTRTLINSFSKECSSPKELLEIANDYLHKNTASNYFVSMFYGIIDIRTMKMSYCSAGHTPTYILRNSNIKELPAGGIALGAVSNTSFSPIMKQKSVQLNKSDILVLYTDGIIEAMDSESNEFGEENFINAAIKGGSKPQKVIDNSVKAVEKFTKGFQQNDDITLLSIKIK